MKTLYTGEDLLRLKQPGRWEVVRGELIELTPPGCEHGEIQVNVASLLKGYAKQVGGRVLTESGVYLERQPDTVRGPDVSFYSPGKLETVPTGFSCVVPDLVVEIISPGDSSQEVEGRLQEYLAAGVRRVWLLYPRTRTVYVHGQGRQVYRCDERDTLVDEEVLPGFSCRVAEFFDS
ncbi:MAG: Uma2 family endonuclease [Candidatus Eremiobacterota bacterium]